MGKKHLVIAYTGEGKGKTTAALGLAFRALGYDKKVKIVQFIKSTGCSGEEKFAKKVGITFVPMGRGFVGILGDKKNIEEHKRAAKNALVEARKQIIKRCDILILDEILVAIDLKLIEEEEVINFIEENRNSQDIVLTGRGASKKMIDLCDLVTNMQNVKHPFGKGMEAIESIDY